MQMSRCFSLAPSLPAVTALLVLFAAEEAFAAKKVVADVMPNASLLAFHQNGAEYSLNNQAALFDNDPETTCGVTQYGDYIIMDFSPILSTAEPVVYMEEISFDLPANASLLKYSLYVSTNYVDASNATWTPIKENADATDSVQFKIQDRFKAIKFVFESDTYQKFLSEFHVMGFSSSAPEVVSNLSLADLHSSDGTSQGQGGTGGGSLFSQIFDGKFSDPGNWRPTPVLFPNIGVGDYILIDFSSISNMPNGYFVTEIKVGHSGLFPFSLYYWSSESNEWAIVPEAYLVQETKIDPPLVFGLNETTTKIKYVFEQATAWDYGNGHMSEIQVWGLNPDHVPCTHKNLKSVPWTNIEGSETCTEKGIAERFCPDCGERFTKVSDVPPLGHDYVTTLHRAGSYRRFGSGSISCSRCDFFLPCTNVYEQASTNGPVDLAKWGGLAVKDLVQFTDLSVTSTDHPQWGPMPEKLIDNVWTFSSEPWNPAFWVSYGWGDQHVDFTFGTTIDLTKIDICVHNHPDCLLQFYDVDDETGDETLLQECLANFIEGTHEEGVEEIIFTEVSFSETQDATPSGTKTYYVVNTNETTALYVPATGLSSFEENMVYYEASADGATCCKLDGSTWKQTSVSSGFETNATYAIQSATADKYYTEESSGKFVSAGSLTEFASGTHYYRLTGETSGPNLATIVDSRPEYTRQTVRFYSTPCKHLRLRMEEESGFSLWAGHSMCVVEMRPWGTVLGAGDTPYRKETLLLIK